MSDRLPDGTPAGEMAAHYCIGMCADWAGHPEYEGDEHAGLRDFLAECADGLRWQRDEIARLRDMIRARMGFNGASESEIDEALHQNERGDE
jgi:hypothetical protein